MEVHQNPPNNQSKLYASSGTHHRVQWAPDVYYCTHGYTATSEAVVKDVNIMHALILHYTDCTQDTIGWHLVTNWLVIT